MDRRHFLGGLVPLLGLGAGCSSHSQGHEVRDLWTVSVDTIDVDPFELDIELERRTATTEHPPLLKRTYHNPTQQPARLGVLEDCAEINWDEPGAPGLILFLVAKDGFDPQPVNRGCWRPDPETFNWPCEGTYDSLPLASGESWSVRKEVWINRNTECIPEGAFEFGAGIGRSSEEGPQSEDSSRTYVLQIEREGAPTSESA